VSQKKVNIQRPKSPSAESWVMERPASPPQEEAEIKRLTIDIPVDLHRRIKVACYSSDRKMSEVLREIMEEAFPRNKNG
jgi:hypothetical protein